MLTNTDNNSNNNQQQLFQISLFVLLLLMLLQLLWQVLLEDGEVVVCNGDVCVHGGGVDGTSSY